MIRPNKYSLPCAYRLPHIKFDLQQLRRALIPLNPQFTDIYEANKGLCSNHEKLADSVKEHFFQVSLTTCSTPKEGHSRACGGEAVEMSRPQKYRLATSRRTDFPYMDEHNWNIPTKLFQKSYFYKCVRQFKASAIRVRLTTIQPGKKVTPHIDYNVDYAVRIVVPIYTNEQCWNYFWRKGRKIKLHIPADGHPWFLNVGLRHSVENLGTTNRTVLMFSLSGTEDIMCLFDLEQNAVDVPIKKKPKQKIQRNTYIQKNDDPKTI